jgi:hypothetical protein
LWWEIGTTTKILSLTFDLYVIGLGNVNCYLKMAQDVTEEGRDTSSDAGDPPRPSVSESSQCRDVEAKLPDPDMFSGTDKNGINPGANRFPYCIVWTPIPLLT